MQILAKGQIRLYINVVICSCILKSTHEVGIQSGSIAGGEQALIICPTTVLIQFVAIADCEQQLQMALIQTVLYSISIHIYAPFYILLQFLHLSKLLF